MATAPDRYPLHDTSDSNSANLPTTYSLNGFLPNSIGDSRAVNKLLQSNGGWVKYNDFTLVRAGDTHNSSTAYRLSSVNLSYTTGAGLGPFSPVSYLPVYVYRGNVIRFSSSFCVDAGLDPITFTASMRTWVYCSDAGVVRVDVVALATAATPAAGEFTVVAIDTDATDITAIETGSSPAYELHFTGPTVIMNVPLGIASDLAVTGNVEIGGTLEVTGATTLSSTLAVTGLATIGAGATVTGEVAATSSHVTSAAVLGTNSSTGPGIRGTGTSNSGVQGVSAGSVAGVAGTNSGAGPGVKGTGGTAAPGVEGVATVAAQPGVEGTGAAAAGSHGVVGVAVDTASYGAHGSSSAAATTSGAGVRADALGAAPGLWSVATDGHAALLTSDVSSPTRAALRITPQDADPTTTGVGDILVNSSRQNKIRHHNGSTYLSVHSSANGYVKGVSTVEAGSNVASSGDICSVTITPEVAGIVIVTVTGWWEGQADGTIMNVLLKDITGAVTIYTTQDLVAQATVVVGERWKQFTVSYPYTLPSGATRNFMAELNVTGATDWEGVFMTVEGVF